MDFHSRVLIEVCIASVEDAITAATGGADRLELNVALELDGLTPTVGLLEEVKAAVTIPVIAMIRPRAGGFRYSSAELRLMIRDAEMLLAAGSDGIASGALGGDGTIDGEFWEAMRCLAKDRELVFHRAFDVLPNQITQLQSLIDLGTDRVLTSGGARNAWDGREQIAQLQQVSSGRIEILPGAGVSPENAMPLVRATGCNQIHGSFKRMQRDSAGSLSEHERPMTCQELIKLTRFTLDSQRR